MRSGIDVELVLEWIHLVDLMGIELIGARYVDLLTRVGVTTVKELACWEVEESRHALAEVNEREHLVTRLPSSPVVTGRIRQAHSSLGKVQSAADLGPSRPRDGRA